jgi:hypothetical protein
MPLKDFKCNNEDCSVDVVELLVKTTDNVACPECGEMLEPVFCIDSKLSKYNLIKFMKGTAGR